MQFQILGPLEVHGEHGPVALGGAKPRAVLAVLLLHANEAVSAERLALALWGEDAPGGAVKTVQVHVSRLRKALGAGDVISTTSAGYRLHVRPDELDAERFERLVEDGRRALADGQPEHAAGVLREALALWRGQPLGDLALEPFAQSETARLEEERLAAIEARVEADLYAGRHADLVGELQRLVAENPLRERFAGQLMLALYRCGRQTEALEVYQSARRVLISEVGVEPGPELRRLQEAILRQDASLGPEPTLAELPRELDASASPPLLGRDPELEWLVDRWERARTGAGVLVGVAGKRGAGKTRLAAQLAGRVHGAQAAVIHASGGGWPDALRSALRRARETSRATLLVIDDADRAERGVLDGLRELKAVGGLLVLITGEDARALGRLGASAVLELAPLDVEAAHAIAMLYAPGRMFEDVPAQWLVDSSDGIARRLHELASHWARREAARRVGAVAGRAAAGREQLRSIQDELTGGVEELQAADERLARAGEDDAAIVCPFKGLASFDVADAPYFFGRERLVAELVARLVGAPLLGVVGPSGSGKSSVMRAGLLPALASGVLPGSHEWAQVLIRPGEHPLRELAEALARVDEAPRIVIAVDQFEETFTACEDEQERAEFIAELGAAAAAGRDGRYVVVMALRADFYGRCAAYPELAGPLAANHVLVPSMQRDELRRAIERPAERVGLRVEPELSDTLIADVRDEPGALPLLQTTLLELWQRRDGRRLRYSVYEQSGGVRGAVARLAEDAFGQLDEGQQILARGVLMRLAGEGEGGGVERRRVPLAELEIERSEELARAVALLTDRRLLTASAGSIELAHEALLREWPRLRDWIEENREGLRIHRNLGAAAREWQSLERDEGALYRGTRLSEALEWAAVNPHALNEVERGFLSTSDAVRQRERITRRRRIAAAFGGLTTVLVAVAVVAIIAVSQSREAQRQRDVAASRELAARSASLIGSDPRLSLALALAALKRHDTEQAQSAVRQAALADRTFAIAPAHEFAYSVASSHDGRRLVTTGEEGLVRVWSVANGTLESTIKGHKVSALAASFSPDGARVASVGDDGEIAIADTNGGGRRVLLRLPERNYPRSVEFTPDGKRLLVATNGGTVGLVQTRGRRPRLRLLGTHSDRAKASLNRSGTKAVSASRDRTARVWNVASGASITLRHPVSVLAAAFSPDGRLAATAADDGVVRIWDVAGGRRIRSIRVDQDGLGSVRFSADGRRIVTAGIDGVVRVSAVGGGPPLNELKGRGGPANDAAFVPNSNKVASVGEDGKLRTWAPLQVGQLVAGAGRAPFKQPSFSPNGRDVVSGYDDGDVRVWNPATGADTPLPGHSGYSEATYSADGKHIVSASSLDGSVRLWDVEQRRSRHVPSGAGATFAVAVDPTARRVAIATLDKDTVVQAPDGGHRIVLSGHKGDVTALEFSPDGKHVISASEDGTARIWSVADGTQERKLPTGGQVVDVAYSRDGKRVATAGVDGTVRIWAVTGGAPVLLYGHEGGVNTVAFNPAGNRLVSAGKDGTVRAWNAAGGVSLVTVEAYRGDAPGAAFSPDGMRVVSAGERERVLRIASCELCGPFTDAMRLARSRPARTLSGAERQRLLSSGG